MTAFLLSANLAGVWSAERRYTTGDGMRSARWVSVGAPLDDIVHLQLYVKRQSDGSLTAFVRNPEYNLGALIGERALLLDGDSASLARGKGPDIVGHYDARAGTLTFRFARLPGNFTFRRSPEPMPTPYRYRVPARTADGWHIASIRSAGIDEERIANIINTKINGVHPSLIAPYIQSLLIARHGKLVLDEYFNGFTRDRQHDVRSAGKSVTTLMIGRAIEDGDAVSAQTHVYAFLRRYAPFANFDARKAAITVGDLMAMQSGYACDDNDEHSPGNEDAMQTQSAQPDWYKYTLDLPMAGVPGTRAVYCSAGINLLGAIVAGATHRRLTDYFEERFARPMQFGRYAMWLMPPPANQAYMAGGDYFRPRDFLKFGELFLEHGRWNGRHIIDARWLKSIAVRRGTIEGGGGEYGYGWHLNTYEIGGKKIAAINAGGNGGQLLFVFPQLDMTVMITAANYNQYRVWRGFVQNLVPQVVQASRR